jgi:hypothetical protein
MNPAEVFAQYTDTPTLLASFVLPWLTHQWLSLGAVNKQLRAAYKAMHTKATSLHYACCSKETLDWAMACTASSKYGSSYHGKLWRFALAAAKRDDVPGLLLCKSHPEWSRELSYWLSYYAASAGSINVLAFFASNGELCRVSICDEAIKKSNLALLQWAHAHSCRLGGNPCLLAAGAGDLIIMQWLRQQAVPWDYEKTVIAAAASGNCDSWRLLEWLQQEAGAAPWPQDKLSQLLLEALRAGNTASADWLLEQGAPLPQRLWHYSMYVGPVVLCVAGLQWARAKGCEWDNAWGESSGLEFTHFKRMWLHEAGLRDTYGSSTWCRLALRNSSAAVQWAHANGCCGEDCAVHQLLLQRPCSY